ncbi:MAG: SBBP repeat-containing protein [Candidatus Margulisiibacteriota bacterium]
MSDLGVCSVSTYPQYYNVAAYQNHQLNINPVQPAENYNPPPSDLEGGAAGALAFTSAACDCYGTNLQGDYTEEDASDNYDYWPDAEVAPDESTVEDHYEDSPIEEMIDADGDSYPDEIADETPSEVEGVEGEDGVEEETGPSACDNWPEEVTITSPTDGTIRVPYYTDSALNISYNFPNDPDEATAGDVVTCEVHIDDNPSCTSPLATRGGLLEDTGGVLTFTPENPLEYFACASDYWARVHCFDSCATEPHEVISAPVRFTTGPTVEWTRTYNGAINGYDVGSGVGVDSSGNVFVVGTTETSASTDIWIRGYDSAGNTLWTNTIDGPTNGSDSGNDISIDNLGFIYPIGSVSNFYVPMGGNTDVWIGKYDASDGSQRWQRICDTPGLITFDFDAGYGIAIDNTTGNIWAAGYGSNSGMGLDSLWRGSYVGTGGVRFEQTEAGIDWGMDVAMGNSGNAFIVSSLNVPGEEFNILTEEYDSSGTSIWSETYNGTANATDHGYGISIDNDGNVFITGDEGLVSGVYQPITGMYEGGTRSMVWTQVSRGRGITINNSDNLFVAGDNTERLDAINGDILCSIPESASVRTDAIAADDFGNVYLSGDENVPGEDRNIWVRKYSGF